VQHGRIPLWNPYLFMGAPFLANSQAGVLYPLSLLMAWLPTTRAINLTIVLPPVAGRSRSLHLGARSLGLSRFAAWQGAVNVLRWADT